MPVYRYAAVAASGPTRGFITADSAAEARAQLRKRGLAVRRFREEGSRRRSRDGSEQPGLQRRFALGRGCGDHAVNEATHYLSMLLRAGVPLGEALAVVSRQTSGGLEPVMRRVTEKVNAGEDLATALSDEDGAFDRSYVGVVRVGQASGKLDECLARLIDLRRRRQQLRQRVAAALAYPAIVSVVGIAVVVFLMTFVVPKISELIMQAGRSIPLPTRILLAVTDALRGWAGLLMLAMAGALVVGIILDRRRVILHAFHRGVLRVPVIGRLLMKAGIAQASAMLETMLRSGLPLDEAIQITSQSIRNPLLGDELMSLATAVRSGRPLSEAATANAILPPVVVHMLAIGEQSGQIEDMLGELAAAFDSDVDVAARQAIGVLEPAIIIVISIVVGFIVLATILPIVRISGSF